MLIDACTQVFMEHEDEILDGTFEGSLIKRMEPTLRQAYSHCAEVAFKRIYRAKDVLDVELAGYRVISTLIELMIEAVTHPDRAYSRLLINRMASQYDTDAPTLYGKLQAV